MSMLSPRGKKELKINQRRILINSIEIGIPAPEQVVILGQRHTSNGKVVGRVRNSKTLNYKSFTPHRDGLFCERIFGPVQSYICACGKQGPLTNSRGTLKFCPRCEVEYTDQRARRYRIGYIGLVSPVTHIWHLKGRPSYLSLFLGKRKKTLATLAYCNDYLVEQAFSKVDAGTEFRLPPSGLSPLRGQPELRSGYRSKIGSAELVSGTEFRLPSSGARRAARARYASSANNGWNGVPISRFTTSVVSPDRQHRAIGADFFKNRILKGLKESKVIKGLTLSREQEKSKVWPPEDTFIGGSISSKVDGMKSRPFGPSQPELRSGNELRSASPRSAFGGPVLSFAEQEPRALVRRTSEAMRGQPERSSDNELRSARLVSAQFQSEAKFDKDNWNCISFLKSLRSLKDSTTEVAKRQGGTPFRPFLALALGLPKANPCLAPSGLSKSFAHSSERRVKPEGGNRNSVPASSSAQGKQEAFPKKVRFSYTRSQTLPFLPTFICEFHLRDGLLSFFNSFPPIEDIPIPVYCKIPRRYPLRDVHKFMADQAFSKAQVGQSSTKGRTLSNLGIASRSTLLTEQNCDVNQPFPSRLTTRFAEQAKGESRTPLGNLWLRNNLKSSSRGRGSLTPRFARHVAPTELRSPVNELVLSPLSRSANPCLSPSGLSKSYARSRSFVGETEVALRLQPRPVGFATSSFAPQNQRREANCQRSQFSKNNQIFGDKIFDFARTSFDKSIDLVLGATRPWVSMQSKSFAWPHSSYGRLPKRNFGSPRRYVPSPQMTERSSCSCSASCSAKRSTSKNRAGGRLSMPERSSGWLGSKRLGLDVSPILLGNGVLSRPPARFLLSEPRRRPAEHEQEQRLSLREILLSIIVDRLVTSLIKLTPKFTTYFNRPLPAIKKSHIFVGAKPTVIMTRRVSTQNKSYYFKHKIVSEDLQFTRAEEFLLPVIGESPARLPIRLVFTDDWSDLASLSKASLATSKQATFGQSPEIDRRRDKVREARNPKLEHTSSKTHLEESFSSLKSRVLRGKAKVSTVRFGESIEDWLEYWFDRWLQNCYGDKPVAGFAFVQAPLSQSPDGRTEPRRRPGRWAAGTPFRLAAGEKGLPKSKALENCLLALANRNYVPACSAGRRRGSCSCSASRSKKLSTSRSSALQEGDNQNSVSAKGEQVWFGRQRSNNLMRSLKIARQNGPLTLQKPKTSNTLRQNRSFCSENSFSFSVFTFMQKAATYQERVLQLFTRATPDSAKLTRVGPLNLTFARASRTRTSGRKTVLNNSEQARTKSVKSLRVLERTGSATIFYRPRQLYKSEAFGQALVYNSPERLTKAKAIKAAEGDTLVAERGALAPPKDSLSPRLAELRSGCPRMALAPYGGNRNSVPVTNFRLVPRSSCSANRAGGRLNTGSPSANLGLAERSSCPANRAGGRLSMGSPSANLGQPELRSGLVEEPVLFKQSSSALPMSGQRFDSLKGPLILLALRSYALGLTERPRYKTPFFNHSQIASIEIQLMKHLNSTDNTLRSGSRSNPINFVLPHNIVLDQFGFNRYATELSPLSSSGGSELLLSPEGAKHSQNLRFCAPEGPRAEVAERLTGTLFRHVRSVGPKHNMASYLFKYEQRVKWVKREVVSSNTNKDKGISRLALSATRLAVGSPKANPCLALSGLSKSSAHSSEGRVRLERGNRNEVSAVRGNRNYVPASPTALTVGSVRPSVLVDASSAGRLSSSLSKHRRPVSFANSVFLSLSDAKSGREENLTRIVSRFATSDTFISLLGETEHDQNRRFFARHAPRPKNVLKLDSQVWSKVAERLTGTVFRPEMVTIFKINGLLQNPTVASQPEKKSCRWPAAFGRKIAMWNRTARVRNLEATNQNAVLGPSGRANRNSVPTTSSAHSSEKRVRPAVTKMKPDMLSKGQNGVPVSRFATSKSGQTLLALLAQPFAEQSIDQPEISESIQNSSPCLLSDTEHGRLAPGIKKQNLNNKSLLLTDARNAKNSITNATTVSENIVAKSKTSKDDNSVRGILSKRRSGWPLRGLKKTAERTAPLTNRRRVGGLFINDGSTWARWALERFRGAIAPTAGLGASQTEVAPRLTAARFLPARQLNKNLGFVLSPLEVFNQTLRAAPADGRRKPDVFIGNEEKYGDKEGLVSKIDDKPEINRFGGQFGRPNDAVNQPSIGSERRLLVLRYAEQEAEYGSISQPPTHLLLGEAEHDQVKDKSKTDPNPAQLIADTEFGLPKHGLSPRSAFGGPRANRAELVAGTEFRLVAPRLQKLQRFEQNANEPAVDKGSSDSYMKAQLDLQAIQEVLSYTGGGALKELLRCFDTQAFSVILLNEIKLLREYHKGYFLHDYDQVSNKATLEVAGGRPEVLLSEAEHWSEGSKTVLDSTLLSKPSQLARNYVPVIRNSLNKSEAVRLRSLDNLRSGFAKPARWSKVNRVKINNRAEEENEYEELPEEINRFSRAIHRNARRLKIVQLLMRNKRRPEWMLISALPVLPPDLRPILQMSENLIVASDLNTLYQRVIYRNNRQYKLRIVEWSYATSLQRLVQDAVDRLIENGKGGSKPFLTPNGRPLKSLSDTLKGKKGRFRLNLLGKRVDFSGRSVIVVSPHLKIHECGLPREMALELYQYLLIRQMLLKRQVSSVILAKRLIRQQKAFVWDTLRELIYHHPVLLNRAPTLHRLGIQAFQPKLVLGSTILLHPLVCTGFNADFDGDQMGVHLPLCDEARAEAWDLLWSRNNLLSPATGEPILLPSQDMVLGFYHMTALLPSLDANLIAKAAGTTRSITRSADKTAQTGLGFVQINPFSALLRTPTEVAKRLQSHFFSSLGVVRAYQKGDLDIHTPIWLQWNGKIENNDSEQTPLEVRINSFGVSTQLYPSYKYRKNASSMSTATFNQFIRTTAGRVIVNNIFPLSINQPL